MGGKMGVRGGKMGVREEKWGSELSIDTTEGRRAVIGSAIRE
jgi:hypothetical protein